MKLQDYFEAHKKRTGKKLKKSEFGKRCEATGAAVGKWLTGTIPSPDMMGRIEKATSGKVKPADFYQ